MTNENLKIVFRGSIINGLQKPDLSFINLAEWCGLSEDQYYELMEIVSDIDIIKDCVHAEFRETFKVDNFAAGSDVFFKVLTADVGRLRQEVRETILSYLAN